MKFCTHCGKALQDNEKCTCQPTAKYAHTLTKGKSFCVKLLQRMGIGTAGKDSATIFETGQKIVPDIVKANEGETPVKQYEVAFLRSRIRGQFAKGRLQVTNKRLIFRASGMSLNGPVVQQYEFSLAEISGIEIKQKNRISPLNVVLGLLLNAFFLFVFTSLFYDFNSKNPAAALFVSVWFGLSSAIPFFVLKKRFWLKLLSLSCGLGMLAGTGGLANAGVMSLFIGLEANLADFLSFVLSWLFIANLILVSLVPDLVFIIKTKGGSPAFEIRRKLFPTPFRQQQEYTDFSEVLAGKDVDAMITELGTLIDDLQTIGDAAISNWAEDEDGK